ncbi:protein-tyrosine phosphatase [Streptomyces griseochromogenes]|uniref:protein-tyrosine-phosphatase n=1 Tax=Streptomyces griseochromogenes TaxID=68214 RepID=A0A1B1BBG5_9ACTN|nr:low molecular weight protein-tyrosine-phosphatase [Streptomyces griseochromogenes]ANP56158.1 protein tyrosine phosphatase [Streptomyces griseochromogenes]MBP2050967.1 protein-tyrosine phosphatase [Streptomyces griseochromogenes]
MTYRVCFVCTGNICRSPMAESVFRARVEEAGLHGLVEIDSAGTGGWHEGEPADPRAASVLEEHGYRSEHAARQFQPSWFARLDLVIALDSGHLKALRRLAPTEEDARKIRLLRTYTRPSSDLHPSSSASHAPSESAGDDLDVPDPYYGGRDGFEECLEMVEAASNGLLAAVREHLEGRAA